MGGGGQSRSLQSTKRLLQVAVEHKTMLPQISLLLYNAFCRQHSKKNEGLRARNNEFCNWMRSCNAYFLGNKEFKKRSKDSNGEINMESNVTFK
jgi:hypothetical protein